MPPLAGQNRFGMKLHAVDRPGTVTQPHDAAVFTRPRRHLELARQPFYRHDQRVVSRGDERPRNAAEHTAAVVLDRRRLAVHWHARPHHRATEHGANRLMTEADAENRRRLSEPADDAHRHTRLL